MASCPRCGFDLDAAGVCSVCGFGKADAGTTSPALFGGRGGEDRGEVGSSPEARSAVSGKSEAQAGPATSRRPRLLWVLLGGTALLVAAAATLLFAGVLGGGSPRTGGMAVGSAVADGGAAPPAAASASGSPTLADGGARSVAPATADLAPGATAALPGGAAGERASAGGPSAGGGPASAPSYEIADTADPPIESKESYVAWMLANTSEREPYLSQKWERAQIALGRGDITHRRVLMAFLLTPRESFVRSYNRSRSYADAAMPIGYGQTISGPHLVSRMTDALDPQPHHRVLEIGTGSGYQSAVLAVLSDYVFTIEIVKPLYEETDALYRSLSADYPMYGNIRRLNADGYFGWQEHAPFDRIIVTAAIDHIPPDLLKQLAPGGIMVIPVGPPSGQVVLKITKIVEPDGSVRLEREDIYHGAAKKIFVPFTAEGGGVHSLQRDR